MKNIFLNSTIALILLFSISSCTKTGSTGATGPAGPLSTGTLTGYVTTLDQYGYKLNSSLAGVTIHVSDSTKDSTTTSATGAYTFNNLRTGIYTLTYSAPGFAPVVANDYSFLGGGTVLRNQSISAYPSFSLFGVNDTIEVSAGDTGVLIRGIDSVNGVARTFIVFAGTASTVSASPGSYSYVNTATIKAGAGTFSLFIASQALYDAGLPLGSTAYFVAYPISTGAPTYVDPATGQTVYTAIGTPNTALGVVVP
jgi:hypothetical protein